MHDLDSNLAEQLAFLDGVAMAELHTHLGFSISPTMLWELAHDQGIRLPTKDYWEFVKLVTMHEAKPYEEYLKMYDLTETIQSSPEALFLGLQNVVSGAYRKNNIHLLEIRFNPILRSRDGERDLDHIISFALQGMHRGMLKYPVKAGVILMMDRRFTPERNLAIVKKAIKYKHLGVVAVDLAGPITRTDQAKAFHPKDLVEAVTEARAAGLGITVHTGEATDTEEMWQVVEYLKPTRIGHGLAAAKDEALMKHLKDTGVILELCPSSNINTKTFADWQQLGETYRKLWDAGITLTINTDGPEMQLTSLKNEYAQLLGHSIFTKEELLQANQNAWQATFIAHA